MIVHVPMFTIAFPDLATLFFSMLTTMVSFNVIEISMILPFLDFTPSEPHNEYFDNMGYGDKNVVNNLGTMFIGFVIYWIAIPLIPCLLFFGRFSGILNKLGEMLRKLLLWNAFLRFLIEGYIEIAISGML